MSDLVDHITEEWVNRGILPATHFSTPTLPELTEEQLLAIQRTFTKQEKEEE